jgi:hypothetical protein
MTPEIKNDIEEILKKLEVQISGFNWLLSIGVNKLQTPVGDIDIYYTILALCKAKVDYQRILLSGTRSGPREEKL